MGGRDPSDALLMRIGEANGHTDSAALPQPQTLSPTLSCFPPSPPPRIVLASQHIRKFISFHRIFTMSKKPPTAIDLFNCALECHGACKERCPCARTSLDCQQLCRCSCSASTAAPTRTTSSEAKAARRTNASKKGSAFATVGRASATVRVAVADAAPASSAASSAASSESDYRDADDCGFLVAKKARVGDREDAAVKIARIAAAAEEADLRIPTTIAMELAAEVADAAMEATFDADADAVDDAARSAAAIMTVAAPRAAKALATFAPASPTGFDGEADHVPSPPPFYMFDPVLSRPPPPSINAVAALANRMEQDELDEFDCDATAVPAAVPALQHSYFGSAGLTGDYRERKYEEPRCEEEIDCDENHEDASDDSSAAVPSKKGKKPAKPRNLWTLGQEKFLALLHKANKVAFNAKDPKDPNGGKGGKTHMEVTILDSKTHIRQLTECAAHRTCVSCFQIQFVC